MCCSLEVNNKAIYLSTFNHPHARCDTIIISYSKIQQFNKLLTQIISFNYLFSFLFSLKFSEKLVCMYATYMDVGMNRYKTQIFYCIQSSTYVIRTIFSCFSKISRAKYMIIGSGRILHAWTRFIILDIKHFNYKNFFPSSSN